MTKPYNHTLEELERIYSSASIPNIDGKGIVTGIRISLQAIAEACTPKWKTGHDNLPLNAPDDMEIVWSKDGHHWMLLPSPEPSK